MVRHCRYHDAPDHRCDRAWDEYVAAAQDKLRRDMNARRPIVEFPRAPLAHSTGNVAEEDQQPPLLETKITDAENDDQQRILPRRYSAEQIHKSLSSTDHFLRYKKDYIKPKPLRNLSGTHTGLIPKRSNTQPSLKTKRISSQTDIEMPPTRLTKTQKVDDLKSADRSVRSKPQRVTSSGSTNNISYTNLLSSAPTALVSFTPGRPPAQMNKEIEEASKDDIRNHSFDSQLDYISEVTDSPSSSPQPTSPITRLTDLSSSEKEGPGSPPPPVCLPCTKVCKNELKIEWDMERRTWGEFREDMLKALQEEIHVAEEETRTSDMRRQPNFSRPLELNIPPRWDQLSTLVGDPLSRSNKHNCHLGSSICSSH